MNRTEITTLRKNRKVKIQEILGEEIVDNEPQQQGRKICAFCLSKKEG